jgi:hypothetical protein
MEGYFILSRKEVLKKVIKVKKEIECRKVTVIVIVMRNIIEVLIAWLKYKQLEILLENEEEFSLSSNSDYSNYIVVGNY